MNPRYPSGHIRLPIVHLRPLGHLSITVRLTWILKVFKGVCIKTHIVYLIFGTGSIALKFYEYIFLLTYFFRRERDSNPRSPCGLNGFRDRPIQPLSHLSGFAAHFRSALVTIAVEVMRVNRSFFAHSPCSVSPVCSVENQRVYVERTSWDIFIMFSVKILSSSGIGIG